MQAWDRRTGSRWCAVRVRVRSAMCGCVPKALGAVDAVHVRVVWGRGFVHVHEPAVAGNLGFLRLQLRLEDELVGSLLLVGADDRVV